MEQALRNFYDAPRTCVVSHIPLEIHFCQRTPYWINWRSKRFRCREATVRCHCVPMHWALRLQGHEEWRRGDVFFQISIKVVKLEGKDEFTPVIPISLPCSTPKTWEAPRWKGRKTRAGQSPFARCHDQFLVHPSNKRTSEMTPNLRGHIRGVLAGYRQRLLCCTQWDHTALWYPLTLRTL